MAFPPEHYVRRKKSELPQAVRHVLQHPGIDVIVCNTLALAYAVADETKSIPVVTVLHDIEQIYSWRRFLRSDWTPYKLVYFADWFKVRLWENRLLRSSRNLIVMSKMDKRRVREINSRAPIAVVPNGVDTKYFNFHERLSADPNILFVGNFAYPPNEDGFWYFYREIFPSVRKQVPAASLWAVGRDPTPEMCELQHQDVQVRVTGFVPDMRSYYEKSAVCVVPIRFGGGTRLKVLEAFSVGVPVVSTTVGIEGIPASPEEHLLVRDTAREFAHGVAELLKRPESGQRLASAARRLVEEKYDWSIIGIQLDGALASIRNGIAAV